MPEPRFDKELIDRNKVLDNSNKLLSLVEYTFHHNEKLMTCVCEASIGGLKIISGEASAMQRNYYSKAIGEAESQKKVDLQLMDALVGLELFHQLRLINEL